MAALKAVADAVAGAMEELNCPICLSVATDAVVLTCGHLGCGEHIAEWLTRKLECPTCRAVVDARTVKSHALDGVLSRLTAMADLVERARMDRALTRSVSQSEAPLEGPVRVDGVDAIERLFRSHVREALQSTTSFALELQMERDAAIRSAAQTVDAVRAAEAAAGATAAAAATAAAPAPAPAPPAPAPAPSARLAAAEAAAAAATAAAHAKYAAAMAALQGDVESYLADAAPPLALMPCSVTVSVPALRLRFDVRLRPMDTIAGCIQPAVARLVQETSRLDVVTYGGDAVWSFQPAPSPAEVAAAAVAAAAGGAAAAAAAAAGGAAAAPLATPRLDVTLPLYRQCARGRPEPGAVLTCSGSVTAASSRATKCMVDLWTPGTREDYFWCTTCALKWVCSTCATSCHRAAGHTVVPFLTAHAPTFACCYCRTRGACKLPPAAPATPAAPSSA